LAKQTGLSSKRIGSALYRLWKKGGLLRTEKPTYEALKVFKGRAGIKKNTRAYHLYMFVPGKDSASFQGTRFVKNSSHKCFEQYDDATKMDEA